MRLARVEEEKIQNIRRTSKPTFQMGASPYIKSGGGPNLKNQTSGQSHTSHHSTTPVKRLNHQEIKEKREKGLYFYCNEKYVAGHKCQSQRVLRLDVALDVEVEDVEWGFEEEQA